MAYDFTDRTAQFDAEESAGTELLDSSGNGNHLEDNLTVPSVVSGKIGQARGPTQSLDQHFRKAFAPGGPWDVRGEVSCCWLGWYMLLNTEQPHGFEIEDAAGANAEGQALVLTLRDINTGPEGPWCFMGGGVTRWVGASLKIAEQTVIEDTWQFFAAGYDAVRGKLYGAWGRDVGEFYYNETDGPAGGFGYDGTNSETMIGRFNGEAGTAEINVDHSLWFKGRALDEADLRILWNNHAALPFDELISLGGRIVEGTVTCRIVDAATLTCRPLDSKNV